MQDEELLELEKRIESSKRMSDIEFIGWSIALAGILFFLDAWLSELLTAKKADEPVPIVERTDQEKETLCRAWKDCEHLAKAVVYESRGEGRLGMKAVAYVIVNRKEHKHWPDTIEDVIHQPNQFAFLKDWNKQVTPTQKDWTLGRVVSYNVLKGIADDPTNGATHYTEKSVYRKWMNNLEYVTTIQNHKFFKGDY